MPYQFLRFFFDTQPANGCQLLVEWRNSINAQLYTLMDVVNLCLQIFWILECPLNLAYMILIVSSKAVL